MNSYVDLEEETPKKVGDYKVIIENVNDESRQGVATWNGEGFEQNGLKHNEFITGWKEL